MVSARYKIVNTLHKGDKYNNNNNNIKNNTKSGGGGGSSSSRTNVNCLTP